MWGKGRMEDDHYAGVRNASSFWLQQFGIWEKIKGYRDVSVRDCFDATKMLSDSCQGRAKRARAS